MRTMVLACAGSVTLLFGLAGGSATAEQWDVNRNPIAVRLSMAGQLTGVRYSQEEPFWPVEQGVAKAIVKGLAFHPRRIPWTVYFLESEAGDSMAWHWVPFCFWFMKPLDQIRGDILADIDMSDGEVSVHFPDGQVVTMTQEGEIDWGGKDEFRSGDFREELAAGLSFLGFHQFTLFEFVGPDNEIVSRNVAAEIPFDQR